MRVDITRLFAMVCLAICFPLMAGDLRTFTDGQVIDADDFNHNFGLLEAAIDSLIGGVTGPAGMKGEQGDSGEQGPSGLPGIQGRRGNDGADGAPGIVADLNCQQDQRVSSTESGWQCADDPYVSLNCNEGDKLKFSGGAWGC